MSYEQALRHSRNHRKDRFTQQCGGPVHEPNEPMTQDQMGANEICSLERIADRTDEYPIYIKPVSGGVYVTVNERDSFATKIESRDELDKFILDFVL